MIIFFAWAFCFLLGFELRKNLDKHFCHICRCSRITVKLAHAFLLVFSVLALVYEFGLELV